VQVLAKMQYKEWIGQKTNDYIS